MTVCRTLAEVRAAAIADSKAGPPLSQDQADFIAARLASYRRSHSGRYQADRQPGEASQ